MTKLQDFGKFAIQHVTESYHWKPTLFFIVEEVGLRGIAMPLDGTNVVDVEFADDTSLYLDGHINNLQKMYTTVQTFCMASGASINWNKSMGFG